MNRQTRKTFGALAIFIAVAFAPPATADLFSLTDVNADPNIFECDLTAIETDVTIGGDVSGMTAGTLVLQNNGGDDETIPADGSFTFSATVANGDDYVVNDGRHRVLERFS